MDFNYPSSDIIRGVFTDDDLFNIGTPTSSSALIDFQELKQLMETMNLPKIFVLIMKI